jgi:F-type H+-transporting ATPase subunit 6
MDVTLARVSVRRNLGASAVAMKPAAAATDPIQKLFADKVNEYAQKKKASGGKLVDATKEVEAALHEELDKVAKSYGGGDGIDMTKFPDFKFVDPKIDNVDLICDEVSCKRW